MILWLLLDQLLSNSVRFLQLFENCSVLFKIPKLVFHPVVELLGIIFFFSKEFTAYSSYHAWKVVVYDILWILVICPEDGFLLFSFFVAHWDALFVQHYSAWLRYFLQKVFENRFLSLTTWLILFGTLNETIFFDMVVYCKMHKCILKSNIFISLYTKCPEPS